MVLQILCPLNEFCKQNTFVYRRVIIFDVKIHQNLKKALLSEPPFTRKIPYEHLQHNTDNIENEDPPIPDPNIPCPYSIQATERYVQLLSSVVKLLIDKNREGIMANTIESRKKISRMETKKDFQGNL